MGGIFNYYKGVSIRGNYPRNTTDVVRYAKPNNYRRDYE
jgi:hypothetical protein